MAKHWFALISEGQPKRGTHRSTLELVRAIREYVNMVIADPEPSIRTKTADEILASVARFFKRVSDSGN
jgi:hypothetical protein